MLSINIMKISKLIEVFVALKAQYSQVSDENILKMMELKILLENRSRGI